MVKLESSHEGMRVRLTGPKNYGGSQGLVAIGVTWYKTRIISMGNLTVVVKVPNVCHFMKKVYCDPRLLTSSGSPQDPSLPHSS